MFRNRQQHRASDQRRPSRRLLRRARFPLRPELRSLPGGGRSARLLLVPGLILLAALLLGPGATQTASAQAAETCTGVSIAVSPGGASTAGDPLDISATPAGCTTPQYDYWHLFPDGSWERLAGWSSTNPLSAVDTTGWATGLHRLWVGARGGSSGSVEAVAEVTHEVIPSPCTAVALSTVPGSPTIPGTALSLAPSSSGCSAPQYDYWHLFPDGSWERLAGWSSTNPLSTVDTTTWPVGQHRLWVGARAHTSGSLDVSTVVVHDITDSVPTQCSSVTLAAGPTGPTASGIALTLTPVTSACATPQYDYWHLFPSGAWERLASWSSTSPLDAVNTTTWAAGSHYLWVGVRAGTTGAVEASAQIRHDIQSTATPCTGVSLSLDSATPTVGDALTMTATATGCSTAQYDFWHMFPGGTWEQLTGWTGAAALSGVATAAWPTGEHRIWVGVRSHSNATTEAFDEQRPLLSAPAATTGRVTDGLVALYDFSDGSGTVVSDVSGVGTALDLSIPDATAVQWLAGSNGIEVVSGTGRVEAADAPWKILNSVGSTGQITIEAWVTPTDLLQAGPARVVTISAGPSQSVLNMHLGQNATGGTFRLHTTENRFNELAVPAVFADATQPRHVVGSYDGATMRFYVDGALQTTSRPQIGDFTTWDVTYPLVIGNEASYDRPFLGNIYLVAFYDHPLDAGQVLANFQAGPGAGVSPPPPPPANSPSVANDDAITVIENASKVLDVRANDTDADGDVPSVISVTQPANGVTSTDGLMVTYTPSINFNGTDVFSYELADGKGGVDFATVTLTIEPLGEQSPVAQTDYYYVPMDNTLTRTAIQGLLVNDTDLNFDPLTAQLISGVANGTLALSADGSFTYTPTAGFAGNDSFVYVAIDDGGLQSDPTTVTVVVADGAASELWVTGWYVGWFQNDRPPSEIDYDLITHVMHFMIQANPDGSLVALGARPGFGTAEIIASVVDGVHANGRKILVTVGGAGNYDGFASAITPAYRATFVNNLVNFVLTHNYDGVDVDMEPVNGENFEDFKQFNIDLRAAMDAAAPNLLLTVAAGPAEPICQVWYLFDQINLMTYDMSGAWQGWVTWHNSPILNGGEVFPAVPSRQLPSADQRIQEFLAHGCPAQKLSIGFDTRSYIWTGGDGTDTGGVTRPRQEWTTKPTVTKNVMYTALDSAYDLTQAIWDPIAQAVYLSIDLPGSADDQFVSFDNEQTAQAKVDYVRTRGLGGIAIWELYGGYFKDRPVGQRDPLLDAIKAAILTP